MKNLLVVYSTGFGVDSVVISVPVDYSPTDDDMEEVKKRVVEAKRPKYQGLSIDASWHINRYNTGDTIKAEHLVILNLQRLNI